MRFSRSILIVEDEDIIRLSLEEFLSERGYFVKTAATAEEAFKQARERDFDVAICDVQQLVSQHADHSLIGTQTREKDRAESYHVRSAQED